MTQLPFLFKWPNIKRVYQGDLDVASVERPEIVKAGRTESLGGLGLQFMEPTGRVAADEIQIRIPGLRFTMKATRDGVREQVRRLRPEEHRLLDQIDVGIAALETELALLRARRLEALRLAWDKAHVVTVKELVERIKK